MRGKQKCKILKEIRQRIADENDIPFVTRECSFQGECTGTCPRCESDIPSIFMDYGTSINQTIISDVHNQTYPENFPLLSFKVIFMKVCSLKEIAQFVLS